MIEVGADCFRIPDVMFNPSLLQVLTVMEVLWIMKTCWPSLDPGRGFFAFRFGLNCWLILINLVGLVQTIPGMEKFGAEVNAPLQGLPQMHLGPCSEVSLLCWNDSGDSWLQMENLPANVFLNYHFVVWNFRGKLWVTWESALGVMDVEWFSNDRDFEQRSASGRPKEHPMLLAEPSFNT
jgi:hypothetical protein